MKKELKPSSLSRRLTVGFVVFHLFALLLFALPIENLPARAARTVIAPYMRCLGLTDTWDMFAPNPKSAEQFLRAIVVTKSGQYKLYSFPRMEEMGLLERYKKERYRKFSESLLCDECGGLWPDVERAVARRYADAADPPEKVILVKYESAIDPKSGALGEDAAAKTTVLSQLVLQPGDLR